MRPITQYQSWGGEMFEWQKQKTLQKSESVVLSLWIVSQLQIPTSQKPIYYVAAVSSLWSNCSETHLCTWTAVSLYEKVFLLCPWVWKVTIVTGGRVKVHTFCYLVLPLNLGMTSAHGASTLQQKLLPRTSSLRCVNRVEKWKKTDKVSSQGKGVSFSA